MEITFSKQIESYICKGIPTPLLAVSTQLENLAAIYNLNIQSWTEDGLGPQKGFIIELSNGLIIAAENHILKPELGVTLSTDRENLSQSNLNELIAICISIFSINKNSILWQQTYKNMGYHA